MMTYQEIILFSIFARGWGTSTVPELFLLGFKLIYIKQKKLIYTRRNMYLFVSVCY